MQHLEDDSKSPVHRVGRLRRCFILLAVGLLLLKMKTNGCSSAWSARIMLLGCPFHTLDQPGIPPGCLVPSAKRVGPDDTVCCSNETLICVSAMTQPRTFTVLTLEFVSSVLPFTILLVQDPFAEGNYRNPTPWTSSSLMCCPAVASHHVLGAEHGCPLEHVGPSLTVASYSTCSFHILTDSATTCAACSTAPLGWISLLAETSGMTTPPWHRPIPVLQGLYCAPPVRLQDDPVPSSTWMSPCS